MRLNNKRYKINRKLRLSKNGGRKLWFKEGDSLKCQVCLENGLEFHHCFCNKLEECVCSNCHKKIHGGVVNPVLSPGYARL